MNAKILIGVALASLVSVVSEAKELTPSGGQEGYGGIAVVCPEKVELLDLWEAENLLGFRDQMRIQRSSDDLEAQLERAFQKLVLHPKLQTALREETGKVRRNVEWIPAGTRLFTTIDHGAFLVPRESGCILQNVAMYRLGKIAIDRDLFERMPTTDQAALFLHEAVYSLIREDGSYLMYEWMPTAVSTRRLVSVLIQESGIEGMLDALVIHYLNRDSSRYSREHSRLLLDYSEDLRIDLVVLGGGDSTPPTNGALRVLVRKSPQYAWSELSLEPYFTPSSTDGGTRGFRGVIPLNVYREGMEIQVDKPAPYKESWKLLLQAKNAFICGPDQAYTLYRNTPCFYEAENWHRYETSGNLFQIPPQKYRYPAEFLAGFLTGGVRLND